MKSGQFMQEMEKLREKKQIKEIMKGILKKSRKWKHDSYSTDIWVSTLGIKDWPWLYFSSEGQTARQVKIKIKLNQIKLN